MTHLDPDRPPSLGRRIVEELVARRADKYDAVHVEQLAEALNEPQRRIVTEAQRLIDDEKFPVEQLGVGAPERLYFTRYSDAKRYVDGPLQAD